MRVSRGAGGRVWLCGGAFQIGDAHCGHEERIAPGTQLPVATIAEDMARTLWTSSADQARKQANYRRIAGSIRKLDALYLSDDEQRTLAAAAEILERLATAAERAKRSKQRREEEEQARQERRRRLIAEATASAFATDPGSIIETALDAIAIAQLNKQPMPFGVRMLETLLAQHRTASTVSGRLLPWLRGEHTAQLRDLRGGMVWRPEPVDDLVARARQAFALERMRAAAANGVFLDALRETLAIERAGNVVKLPR